MLRSGQRVNGVTAGGAAAIGSQMPRWETQGRRLGRKAARLGRPAKKL